MYAVYGASGFGREVLPLVRIQHPGARLAFIDDGIDPQSGPLNGVEILSFQAAAAEGWQVCIAVADSRLRQALTEKCFAFGLKLFDVRAHTNTIHDDVQIGLGSILCENTVITSNVRIGRSFHLNIYSYVAHDCQIGDFVTFAPKVCCNGNVVIDDHAYIGAGAILKQGAYGRPLRIGAGAIVGMGAVVTKDVAEGATVVGNPARLMTK